MREKRRERERERKKQSPTTIGRGRRSIELWLPCLESYQLAHAPGYKSDHGKTMTKIRVVV